MNKQYKWEEIYPQILKSFIEAGALLNISPKELATEFLQQQVKNGKVLPPQIPQ